MHAQFVSAFLKEIIALSLKSTLKNSLPDSGTQEQCDNVCDKHSVENFLGK